MVFCRLVSNVICVSAYHWICTTMQRDAELKSVMLLKQKKEMIKNHNLQL